MNVVPAMSRLWPKFAFHGIASYSAIGYSGIKMPLKYSFPNQPRLDLERIAEIIRENAALHIIPAFAI